MSLPEQIAEALKRAGHHALDAQTKALGLSRSTTWTIVASQHKTGRLSHKVRMQMLMHPDLPLSVRAILEADSSTAISQPEMLDISKAYMAGKRFVLARPKTHD